LKRVSAEFGYRRSTALCEHWTKDELIENKEESWHKAEQHGKLEQKILKGMTRFLKKKKSLDKDKDKSDLNVKDAIGNKSVI
jgi:hypothetical protein